MATSGFYTGILLSMLIISAVVLKTESAKCCLSYTKRPIRCAHLKDYAIQRITRVCDITAIIFHTHNGRFICANPSMQWAQERIECLKEKAKKRNGRVF